MKERFFFKSFLVIIGGIILGVIAPYGIILALAFSVLSIFLIKYKSISALTLLLSVSILVTVFSYKEHTKTYNGIALTGTASQIYVKENSTSLVLKNCKNKELNKTRVLVHLDVDENIPIKEGNVITVYGDANPITQSQYNPGEWVYNTFADKIGYTLDADKYTVIDKNVNIEYYFSALRTAIKNILFSSVKDEGSASVLYAMVSGDKTYIEMEIIDVFSACGTSHLLAVSGLHVGILLNVVIFVLQKLKVRNIFALCILTVLVLVYSAFTGFSSSVIRASIMAMVLQLSILIGAKYDPLNSLGLAGMLILLFNPFRLYDVAFQLSFSSCFGIIWIGKYFINKPSKILNFIVNSGLVTIGATIFTLPLQLYYFGTVSTISVIANVLLVSVASFALMLTFAFLIPAVIFPQAGVLLSIPGYIMEAIIGVTYKLSTAPSIIFRFVNIIIAVGLMVLMIFFTRFIHVNFKKTVAGIMMIVMLMAFVGNKVYEDNRVKINVPVIDGTLFVHISDEKQYIIGLSDKDIDRQINYISRNIGKADVLIILNDTQMDILPYAIERGLSFDELYVAPEVTLNLTAKRSGAKRVEEISARSGNFTFSSGLEFFCGGKTVFIGDKYSKEIYDLAVSLNPKIQAHTVITKGDNKSAKKLYDIDTCGYTSISIRSNR